MVFSQGMKQRLWVCLIQMSKDRRLQVKRRLKLVFKNYLLWCVKCNRYAISYLYSSNHINFCHEIMWLFQENHCEFQWEFINDANMAHLGCFWKCRECSYCFRPHCSILPIAPFLLADSHIIWFAWLLQASECVAYKNCAEIRGPSVHCPLFVDVDHLIDNNTCCLS